MTRPTKTWLIGLGIFLGYILVALIVVVALRLHGPKMWWILGALAILGLISAALWLWFSREDLKRPTAGTLASGIDATIAAARAQLASSKHVANPKFGSLPILLVLGPTGSTKTTTVIRSGLEPELLAGDVYRGETVAPTTGVNLWYTQNSVVVEAGGPLLNDVPTWQRLLRAMRPRSVMSALTGRAQAPRLALVCFGCDEFYKPGSGEAVPTAARDIRARLGEAAKQFGVQLPTYVIFTKLDGVANFDAFMRNFTPDEAREPLGAAIPPDAGGAGTYADRVTPQLEYAFSELYASLAERRLQTLGREHAPEIKPGAYEFPREFHKLRALAVDFLREIGRPSELAVSPVLRGFYFTGVQAVFVSDSTPEYQPAAVQQAQVAGVRSATAVFGALGASAHAAPVAAPSSGGARKVPRWDFLPRVMREVIFGDAAAVRLTSGGARVNFWRRLGLGLTAGVALFLMIAFAYSYSGNRAMQRRALSATQGIAALPANPVDLPTPDLLRQLDGLRQQLDTLSDYEHNGVPLGLSWGLYSGSKLYQEVRRAYFGGFDRLMFGMTRKGMRDALVALPDSARPTDDYGTYYSLLKAYLITTSNPDKSTPDFLVPALTNRWLAGRSMDSAYVQLGRRQFATYTNELRFENPFPDTANAVAVNKGRAFLLSFTGSQSIYQYMLAEAAKKTQPVQYNKTFPGSAAYLVDTYEVPGPFTKAGAEFMLKAFNTVDQFSKGEPWVVGPGRPTGDKAKIIADLTALYSADFLSHWRKYLTSAQLVRYGDVKDAATKLMALSGNQSPILELLSIAANHTNVSGLPAVAKVFQPVQLVVTPGATDKLVNEKNTPYITALSTLQQSVQKVPGAPAAQADQLTATAISDASNAHGAVRQLATGFNIDNATQVHSIVQSLMDAPITNVEGLLKTFGANEINGKARQFCAQARGVLAKFPFSSDATQQATLQEVAALLKPGTGSLWRFYDEALAAAVPKQGAQYVANPTASAKISQSFVNFLNRAAVWSEVMFKDNSPEPRLAFTVAPQRGEFQSVTVTIDNETVQNRVNGNEGSYLLTTPGVQREAKLSAALGSGAEATISGPYNGLWSVFQLFYSADGWREIPNRGLRAEWEVVSRVQRATLPNGQTPKVTVDVIGPLASLSVLKKGSITSGFDCGNVAQ